MTWYIIAALCWLLVLGSLAERVFVTNKFATALSLVLMAAAWPLTMPAFALLMLWAARKHKVTFPPPFADALTVEGLERLKKELEQ